MAVVIILVRSSRTYIKTVCVFYFLDQFIEELCQGTSEQLQTHAGDFIAKCGDHG